MDRIEQLKLDSRRDFKDNDPRFNRRIGFALITTSAGAFAAAGAGVALAFRGDLFNGLPIATAGAIIGITCAGAGVESFVIADEQANSEVNSNELRESTYNKE